MREEHRPYLIKKMFNFFNRFYVEHFFRPQFDSLGCNPHIMKPQQIEIFGHQIHVGDFVHIISAADNKVRLTTWRSKHLRGRLEIGDYCLISPGVHITAAMEIKIGNNCMIAANCYISDSDWHGIYNRTRPFRCSAPVIFKDNVWLGHGVKVCKGVTIGENSVIGAAAVVTGDIPANVVAAGNPARIIKKIDPNRRMLKREIMFADSKHYFDNQDKLDRFLLANNTLWGWLRSLLFPGKKD